MDQISQMRWREVVWVAVLLAVMLAIFFLPAILTGRALLPTDLIFQLDPLWQPLAPQGFTFPGNQLLSDQVYQSYPWKHYTMHSLAAGRVPLWNPFANGGQPFLANGQSAVFSPFNGLSYLAPLSTSFLVTVGLGLFVAVFFTFLLAREVGIGKAGALLAALAFAFSGPVLVWIGYAIGNVTPWLPAVLFFSERMAARRSWAYALATAIVVGLQFLGGQPEMSFHLMLLWLAYCLYRASARCGRRLSHWFEPASKLLVIAVVGLALAAVALLPFLTFVTESEVLWARAGSQSPVLRTLFLDWHAWPSVVTAVLPQFMGTPANGSYWYPFGNYNEYALYIGVLPLALAIVAVVAAYKKDRSAPLNRSGPPVAFFAVTATVALGVSLHWPIFNLINRLPIFNLVVNGRFLRSIYALAMAILAGAGLDRVRMGLGRSRLETHRGANGFRLFALTTGGIALVSLLAIVSAYGGIVFLKEAIVDLGRRQVEAMQGHILFPYSLEYYYAQVDAMYRKMLALFEPRNAVMYLPVLGGLCVLGLYRWSLKSGPAGRTKWIPGALVLVTAVDLFLVHGNYNPTVVPEQIFPPVGAVQFLQEAGGDAVFRVAGVNLALMPNSSIIFELSDVRGCDAMSSRRYIAVLGLVEESVRLNNYSLLAGVDSPLLDLLNVAYVVSAEPLEGKWELVYGGGPEGGNVQVYGNLDVLPRAFVVHRAEVVGNAEQSLARLAEPAFDYRTTVLLEGDEKELAAALELPAGAAQALDVSSEEATITRYEPERVEIRTHTAADGFLFLADGYDSGWRAELDGRPARIYVADHAFRAVALPAGEHVVHFVYDPLAFKLGVAISALAWGGIAIAAVGLFLTSRRRV